MSFPISRGALLALLAASLGAMPARAQWSADPAANTVVSRGLNFEQFPRAVPDDADGVVVVWQTYAGSLFGYDLRARRLDALGFPVWAVDVAAALHDQRDHQVVADGSGGVIVAWADERQGQLNSDIYAQRIDGEGNRLWGADGMVICAETSIQAYPRIAADGEGGAVIAWRDSRSYGATGVDIYAQRVSAAGASQWASGGVLVCGASGNQLDPGIAADGMGGFVVAWADERLGSTNGDIHAQKLNTVGAPQWTPDGVGLALPANQRWYNDVNPVLADGAGGAMVVFEDDYYTSADIDLHAARFGALGNLAWSPPSRTICASTGIQRLGQPIVGGVGVVIVPWIDWRYGTSDPDIYAQRFDSTGTMLWTGGGLAIAGQSSAQADPVAVRERGGGAFFAWTDSRGGDADVFAKRLDAAGAPIWTWPVSVCEAANQQVDLVAVPSGSCGAILAWRDDRWAGAPPPDNTSSDIYAQRVYCDGGLLQRELVVDVPNGGEVWQGRTYHVVEYHGLDIEGLDVVLEYSADLGATWAGITTMTNSGAHGAYDWRVPNQSSSHCLVRARVNGAPPVMDMSNAVFTIVPDPLGAEGGLAPERVVLSPARPNPIRGETDIVFGLPETGVATLEVYDTQGRLVRTLHEGSASAGWHRTTWNLATERGHRAKAGIYWLRLRASGQTLASRLVVVE